MRVIARWSQLVHDGQCDDGVEGGRDLRSLVRQSCLQQTRSSNSRHGKKRGSVDGVGRVELQDPDIGRRVEENQFIKKHLRHESNDVAN